MMERLTEMDGYASADEAEVARLLRTLEPAAPAIVVERRVYDGLRDGRTPRVRIVRTAVLVGGSLLTTAVLGAALARQMHRRTPSQPPLPTAHPPAARMVQRSGEAAPAVRPPPAAPAMRAPEAAALPMPSAPEAAAVPTPPAPATGEAAVRRRAGRAALPARGPSQAASVAASADPVVQPEPAPAAPMSTTPAPASLATAPPEEAALVLAGLRALRREHDPVRAGSLVGRYLERFPSGVLTQEALALAIEAALARGDRRSATGLAHRYLEGFPTGRFAGLARKAADAAAP